MERLEKEKREENRNRNRGSALLGVIISNPKTLFNKALIDGISNAVRSSGDHHSLMTFSLATDTVVFSAFECQVSLMLAEGVTGVFMRTLSDEDGKRATVKLLSRFRRAKVPVVLIGDDSAFLPKGVRCDSVAAKGGKPTPEVAMRLGGIAAHLMFQRLADPSLASAEVLLDSLK